MLPPSSSSDAVVIVGAGFGGLFTALAIEQRLPGSSIVLIEPNARFIFQPLLYELLSEEMQSWEVAPPNTALLNGRGICWLQDEVLTINRNDRTLTTRDGQRISWSQLVIATGSVPNDFGIPGVRDYSSSFRTMEDVQRIRQWVRDLRQNRCDDAALVIAGAGPTGVELACKLADLLDGSARVHLVEAGEGILPTCAAFNREQAEAALQRREVILHLNSAVSRVLPDRVELASGSEILHSGLIWTAGSRPIIPKIEPPPALERGRLAIESDLRIQGTDDLFAIGDASICSSSPWPATAQVAMQQGEGVSKAIAALKRSETPQPFQFRNLGEMLSLGIGEATVTGMGITLSGPLAFQLRRAAYLTRLPGLSLGVRSAGAWLASR